MLHITSLNDGLDIFKALGSDVRIEILNILLDNNSMSMNELASRLNITNGALTSHIKKLESCGLISISSESAGHGNQKICSVHLDKILIDLERQEDILNVYSTDIKVGHYSVYRICPPAVSPRTRPLSVKWMTPAILTIPTATVQTFSGLPRGLWSTIFPTSSPVSRKSPSSRFQRS